MSVDCLRAAFGDQLRRCDSADLGELAQSGEAEVALTSLDLAEVAAGLAVALMGELLLAHAELFAVRAQVAPKDLRERFLRHMSDARALLLKSLQTYTYHSALGYCYLYVA